MPSFLFDQILSCVFCFLRPNNFETKMTTITQCKILNLLRVTCAAMSTELGTYYRMYYVKKSDFLDIINVNDILEKDPLNNSEQE